MIICVCSNVSDKTIKKLIAEGKTTKEILQLTKACQNCHKCAEALKEVLKRV
jgi:bacterioferritin-associated ferredoxin